MKTMKKYQEGGRIRHGIQSPRAGEARSEEAQRVMVEEMRRQSIPEEDRRAARRDMLREPLTADEVSRVGRSSGEGIMRQQAEAEQEMERRLAQEPSMGTANSRGLLRAMGRDNGMKRGGAVKKMASGGKADGCAARGKTRGKVV